MILQEAQVLMNIATAYCFVLDYLLYEPDIAKALGNTTSVTTGLAVTYCSYTDKYK